MDYQQFINQYLTLTSKSTRREILDVLDFLYLNFTREQALEIVSSYYDNADDIFNTYEE